MSRPANRSAAAPFAIAIVAAACSVAPAAAAPDFSSTTVTASTGAPVEGDLVTFTIIARNTGVDAAEPAWVVVTWPPVGYFVGVRGLEMTQVDDVARELEGYVTLPAGGERRIEVDILTPRDSGGQNLTLAIRVAYLMSGVDHVDRRTVAIDTRAPTSGVLFGGVRFTPVSLAVLGWFVATGLVWIVATFVASASRGPAVSRNSKAGRRLRESAAAITLAVMLPVGFWAIFAAMAWRDYQSLTTWPQTQCTVLGRRVVEETTSSTGTGRTRSSSTTVYSPELALRYAVDGALVHSSGYDTGSSLRVGGRARREQETLSWTPGTIIPCWYNPGDVRDIIVHRGFGGAYLFALFPVPVFLFGYWMMRRQS